MTESIKLIECHISWTTTGNQGTQSEALTEYVVSAPSLNVCVVCVCVCTDNFNDNHLICKLYIRICINVTYIK